MKYIFLSLLIINNVTAETNLNTMIPFHYEHIVRPLNKIIKIELVKVNSEKIEVSYTLLQHGLIPKIVKADFSPYVVSKLLETLKISNIQSLDVWKSDSDCLISDRYKLIFSNSRKVICKNKKQINALKNFQASVEIILPK